MKLFLDGFVSELVKTGSVPNVLKQYRRARKMIESRAWAWHGTRSAEEIFRHGGIKPSSRGRFGPGVYMWKEIPRGSYMHPSNPEGFAVRLQRAERNAKNALHDTVTGRLADPSVSKEILLYGTSKKNGLEFVPKDVAIAAPSDALESARRSLRLRNIHPQIFQRARADIRAEGLARAGLADFDVEDVQKSLPTVSYLRSLVRGKNDVPRFQVAPKKFLEQYEHSYLD